MPDTGCEAGDPLQENERGTVGATRVCSTRARRRVGLDSRTARRGRELALHLGVEFLR